MIDTEFSFEELPLALGDTEVALCNGTALLVGETGIHDYGFEVTGIVLEGNLVGSYRDKRAVHLSGDSSDPFCALLFRRLADRIESDSAAADHFYLARRDRLEPAF
ncbi:hypothetical protein [Hoeflea poritis]|uniref:Uncharacterized protein n=1 Tax=Hoeflea poritis TaxID=2993659 RepID=A0ABT4VJ00_9HYPH|nr:hypothetical protein [Hoeflea poritis]MDA4844155.1 hypothetical protein [Hoeflea poritis]